MRQLIVMLLAALLAACSGSPRGVPPTATSAIDPDRPTPEPGEFDSDPFGVEDEPGLSATENPGLNETLVALGAPRRATRPPGTIEPPFAGVAGDVDIPPAGVVATRVPIDDPDATAPVQEGPYDLIELFRAGGPTGNELQIQFLPDGTVAINGEFARNIGPQGMNEINQLLNDVGVFNITGTFISTFPRPEDYQYSLRVVRDGASVTHRADDTLMPPELARVIDTLVRVAEGSPPPPPQ